MPRAIAFRALVALIPLVLLGLALLGAFGGLKDTWHQSIAPAIKPRVTLPVFKAIDYSAEKSLSSGTAALIVFATALVIWDLSLGVSAVMRALDRVHDIEERRSLARRVATAVSLAICVGACVIGATLILIAALRASGVLHVVGESAAGCSRRWSSGWLSGCWFGSLPPNGSSLAGRARARCSSSEGARQAVIFGGAPYSCNAFGTSP